MPKVDKHGQRKYCCDGNLYGVYGTPGTKVGTTAEWACAVDCYFMSKKGLALSLPPQYGQYMGAAALQMLVCRR